MKTDTTIVAFQHPDEIDDPLTSVLREGARRLLAQAVEAEAEAFLAAMQGERLADGRARVVRHGHGPERTIQTGIGPVPVRRAKLRDRGADEAAASDDERITFTSAILPKWARRTKSLDALLPVLYLRGISTGDFQEALAALLGKDAPNLSPSVIGRLKEEWQVEYDRWQRRDLSARRYVYIWADGVYLQARMEDDAACMLVIVGATPEGRKELVGFQVGVRESAQSWRELLVDLKARGLSVAPEIAVGDGALGFWKALEEIFPPTRHQRCWVHKIVNVLNKVPKSVQPGMKADLREVRDAPGPGDRRGRRHGLRREVRREISQGGRMPDEGSRRAAGLLRLPGRALGSPAHGEPDRERLRNRPASDGAHQGRPVAQHRTPHGLQARHRRVEDLAAPEGRKSLADGRRRRQVHRWCRR